MKFGTDGIRGVVNKDLNVEKCMQVGRGIAIHLLKRNVNKRVLIGRDTRTSGDAYSYAIASALMDYGIDVVDIGIVSTPMISYLVSKNDFGAGIMITASHNDYTYNGIKVFDVSGEKMSNENERDIEICQGKCGHKSFKKGRLIFDNSLVSDYIHYLLENFACDLCGKTIVIDSANGSNYSIAPFVYDKLGANVIKVACNNDGNSINKNCGANHIERLSKEVVCHNADFGIAFDGDGDRLRLVLHDGHVLSGDDILLYFALHLKEKHELNNLTVVGTIMSSMGLEEELNKCGIKLIRTDVGDKNVIQFIKENSLSIGGESSGHICIYKYNPTCDALLNSLFFFKCLNDNLISLKEILNISKKYPSITKNVNVNKKIRDDFDDNISLKNKIKSLENQYENANIVVRPSGTESVIRIYIESSSNDNNIKICKNIEKLLNDFQVE